MKFLNFFLLVYLFGTVLSAYAAMDDDFISDKFGNAVFNRAGRDITCQRLQGYFVGHFVTCIFNPSYQLQLQLQVSLTINATDQRIYGSVDHQNLTYSAYESVYLNLWNKDDDDGKYCNDTQSSCAYSYEEGAKFYASIFSNNGQFFRLITQSNIQNDKFVLKNAVGRCINDPAQSLHWYPDIVSNVAWCVCCDDYESGGDLTCPVNPWQPKEVNSA